MTQTVLKNTNHLTFLWALYEKPQHSPYLESGSYWSPISRKTRLIELKCFRDIYLGESYLRKSFRFKILNCWDFMNCSIYEKRNIFGNLRNSNLLFGIRYGFEIFTMERALKDVPLLKISAVCIIAFDQSSPLKNGFLTTMGVFRKSYLPRNGSPWELICRN